MIFGVAILTVKIEEHMQHFWHIALYYFKKDKSETKEKISAVFGGAVSDWSGTIVEVDRDQIKTLIAKNLHSTTQETVDTLKISKSLSY